MFSYLKGILVEIDEQEIAVEVNGVGYEVKMPTSIISRLPSSGNSIKIYTYFHVREDIQELYGFLDREERTFFKKLISVSGIGPKGAVSILSVLDPGQLAIAIAAGDVKTLSSAPGIGKKTAQRMILELKDKIDNEQLVNTATVPPVVNSNKREAMEALIALGYPSQDAQRAVDSVDNAHQDPAVLVRLALKNIDNRK